MSSETARDEERIRLFARRPWLEIRARLTQSLRAFFDARGYLEVETPLLLLEIAPETHIEPVRAAGRYLQTSPELCMKRLLAAGYDRIFQICRCFRQGERGERHQPEFTLLEWYRAGIDYQDLMAECEALLVHVAGQLGLGPCLSYQGRRIDLTPPWPRVCVAEAFERWGPVPLAQALAEDRFEEVLVNDIEPRLDPARPTILYDYPPSQAALARLRPDSRPFAERFEIYVAGLELANGFSELTAGHEQRARFNAARAEQTALGRSPVAMPERFLAALPRMPEAAGIALGLDRLAMLMADRPRIDDILAFTCEEA